MEIGTAKLVYFSPTETTKAVVEGIAKGIGSIPVESIDVTRPDSRNEPLSASDKDLLIIGVPVYMGRVPALVSDWLNTLQIRDTPTVCVVVYGNRAYDNALLELKDIVINRGGIPIAGAAFIGEHSFSIADAPTAHGRPDEKDISQTEAFGRQINDKLQAASSLSQLTAIDVPGTHPYGGKTQLWDVDFIEVSDLCTQCGQCAELCPAGAINAKNDFAIDQVKCITCCACIKSCPQNARTMKPSVVMDARNRLATLCQERKTPECFI